MKMQLGGHQGGGVSGNGKDEVVGEMKGQRRSVDDSPGHSRQRIKTRGDDALNKQLVK